MPSSTAASPPPPLAAALQAASPCEPCLHGRDASTPPPSHQPSRTAGAWHGATPASAAAAGKAPDAAAGASSTGAAAALSAGAATASSAVAAATASAATAADLFPVVTLASFAVATAAVARGSRSAAPILCKRARRHHSSLSPSATLDCGAAARGRRRAERACTARQAREVALQRGGLALGQPASVCGGLRRGGQRTRDAIPGCDRHVHRRDQGLARITCCGSRQGGRCAADAAPWDRHMRRLERGLAHVVRWGPRHGGGRAGDAALPGCQRRCVGLLLIVPWECVGLGDRQAGCSGLEERASGLRSATKARTLVWMRLHTLARIWALVQIRLHALTQTRIRGNLCMHNSWGRVQTLAQACVQTGGGEGVRLPGMLCRSPVRHVSV
eukprot:357838-Chlamydomonas_euryale.AAC.3